MKINPMWQAMQKESCASRPGEPSSDWYQLYFSAVLEADDRKTLVQIGRACRAIENRLTELRSGSLDNPHEMQDLNCALTYLKLLLQNIEVEEAAPDRRTNWSPTSELL